MNRFSYWLKSNRVKSGLTLMQLRDAIGQICTDAYLSKLENDKFKGKKKIPPRPDKEIVLALADVFRENHEKVLLLAGYVPDRLELPEFLFDINFKIFDENDLAEIENFIKFKANQKGERFIIHRTHTHGTIKADDKAA